MKRSGAGLTLILLGAWLVGLAIFLVWKRHREINKVRTPQLPLVLYLIVSGSVMAVVGLVAFEKKMKQIKSIETSVAVQQALQQQDQP
jgi:hypothetical protein